MRWLFLLLTIKPTQESTRLIQKRITYVTERVVIAWEYGERQMGELYREKFLLHYSKQEQWRNISLLV